MDLCQTTSIGTCIRRYRRICIDGKLYLSNTFTDVQEHNSDRFEHMISIFDGFNLIISESSCNNLLDSNHHSYDRLNGLL